MAAVRLSTLRWGVGNPRSALLLHGLAAGAEGWSRLADTLADHEFEVTAPDLRGHGRSPSALRYTLADFAADVALLGTRWDVIVGHSLGGAIACLLPGSGVGAGRMVLIDPALEFDDESLPAVTADQLSESQPFADPAVWAATHPKWHPQDAFHKAQAARQVSEWTITQIMEHNTPWHHLADAEALRIPTHILGADPAHGAVFTPEMAAGLEGSNPDITTEIVHGAGHNIHRENLDAVVSAILTGR